MAQLVEYVDELIQEVGPRPAGTQQEHQAAELIAARLDGFGLSVDIEEFPCARNLNWVRALYYALCVIGAVVASFSPIPVLGVIVIIIGVVLMVLDYIDKNPLFSLFNNSLSQNVIARYLPSGGEHLGHTRRVVVLAHYDSPRTMVQAAPPLIPHYSLLRRVIRIVMGVLALFSLLLLIPFPQLVRTIIVIVMGIAAVLVLLAFLIEIVNFFMPYNQGANCNGSGIGVLYGLAQILVSGVDVASFRTAAAQARKRQSFRDDTDKRAGRSTLASQAGQSLDGIQRDQESKSVGADENKTPKGGLRGRIQSIAKKRGASSSQGNEKDLRATAQDTQDIAQPVQLEASTTEEQQSVAYSQRITRESPVASVGDQLVNPFISQRPPLAEIEEANRLREEELAKRLEEQRKRLQQNSTHTEDGVPTWFANARKKAELKKSNEDSEGVIRSRFADMPTTRGAASSAGEDMPIIGEGTSPLGSNNAVSEGIAPVFGRNIPEVIRVVSDTSRSGEGADTGVITGADTDGDNTGVQDKATAMPEPFEKREAVPITVKPDLSGLDKAAFRVLPGEEENASKVIVPTETSSTVEEAYSPYQRDPSRGRQDSDQAALFLERGVRDGFRGAGQGEYQGESQGDLRSRLRDLPRVSLDSSGVIPAQQATLDEAPVSKEELFSADNSLISATGAFVPLGTTGIIKPLGEELLEYQDKNEIYVSDADDTSITESYSETGEYSETEIVNIPESRMKSFLGSLGDKLTGKKKEKLDDAPSSWLGVDKKYDVRKEGRDIGSWDNFNEDDEWTGGAYGGESYRENSRAVMDLSHELLDKEVWLVALGASESMNTGLKNLFAYHGSEIKNALFINLLGVGIGDLVFTLSEGSYRPVQTDARMQGLVASAAQSMAIPIAPVDFNSFTTDATVALKEGARAISIIGLNNKVPAAWKWSDDDASSLREDNLVNATSLIIETIKNI